MRVALYARVSKALEQNPENQLIELRRWAAALNHEVFGEFVDEISSRDTRPKKEEVLKLIRQGKIQGVAFWSLDRWGRSMSELVLEIEEFSNKGYIMFSVKEALDISSSAGRVFCYIMASFANYERERIRERTMLGLARARSQGKKLGRPRKKAVLVYDPLGTVETIIKGLNKTPSVKGGVSVEGGVFGKQSDVLGGGLHDGN